MKSIHENNSIGRTALAMEANLNYTILSEQNQPNGYKAVCVWQFDLTAYPLNPHKLCADNTNYSTLSSSFEGFVTGYVVSSSSLRSTYCNVTTGACTSVVDTNLYNLG